MRRTAETLGAARHAARPVPALPDEDVPGTVADAYETQAALADWLTAHGRGTPVGWKVGATTAHMQTYLGVDGPAFGRILAANRHDSGVSLPADAFCHPGIECEIAVRLGDDWRAGPFTRSAAANRVAAVFPAIEIVENRYGDFLARGAPTLIADDFFHKACVAGPETADWRDIDLAAVAGRTLVEGIEKGAGRGADVMGHPLEAVAWLAGALHAQGRHLAAGQIVLTGSVAPVIWLESFPCRAEIGLDGLGPVSVAFD